MTEEKLEQEELTEEELAELMKEYKKELAHVYKVAAAKRALFLRRGMGEDVLRQCDQDMRNDIRELQRKYGIHY